MRGAATKTLSDIVEERQQSRRPPAAAPLRAWGLQQNVNLFLREPLAGQAPGSHYKWGCHIA